MIYPRIDNPGIKTFRLIGRTNIFEAISFYRIGDINCVFGITDINGTPYRTNARIADIRKLT